MKILTGRYKYEELHVPLLFTFKILIRLFDNPKSKIQNQAWCRLQFMYDYL